MNFQELQKQIFNLVGDKNASIADYLKLFKSAEGILLETVPDYIKRPRLAFLSNFTVQGLPEIVKTRGVFHNLFPETYIAPYDQYAQEILDPQSQFNGFNADIVYLFVDLQNLSPQFFKGIVDQLLFRTKAKVVVFDKVIADQYCDNRQILFFDFKDWLKKTGNDKHWYTKYKELGDFRLAPAVFPDFAEALLGYAVAVSGATRKCVVVDLDNTLWQGILGEDGLEGIKPNIELQKFLLGLFNKGIILAINSRNNEEEALQAIKERPEMILRKQNFAAWQINWGDKASNMSALAKKLNIGLDSLAFIDDDHFQQDLVRQAMPAVAVFSFNNHQELLSSLKSYSGFQALELTDEDVKRGQMYAQERSRKELQEKMMSLDDFLRELNLRVGIEEMRQDTLPRAAQLAQKTNQFNLTTKRYSEEDLKIFSDAGWKIWTVKAEDRFGDYGIIGVLMVEPQSLKWRIDSFLLSCRILGRGVEKAVIKHLIKCAQENGVDKILAEYRPTSKNQQTAQFWDNQQFVFIEEKEGQKFYYHEIK